MTLFDRVRQMYALWASRQEQSAIVPGTTLGAWIATTGFIYGLVAVGVALGQFARNDLTRVLLAPAPVIALGYTAAILRQRAKLEWPRFLACAVVGTALLVFAFTTIFLLAAGPAASFFAALVILTASLHSWTMKSAPETPIAGLAVVGGMVGAFALSPRFSTLPLFLLTVGVSSYLSLIIGQWSARSYAERTRIDAYREALQATLLAEHFNRIGTLRETLTDLMTLRHDQRNVAQTLALNVESMAAELTDPGLQGLLADVQVSVDDLGRLLSGPVLGPVLDEVEEPLALARLGEIAPAIARLLQVRFGGVRIQIDLPAADPAVLFRGGATALGRVVLNLLLNACEGDGGAKRSTSVTLRASRDGDVLVTEVEDDGPGFLPPILANRVRRTTSKPTGSGLGLVTVEGLVAASGGRALLANREEGGARVTLHLVVAP